jgi:carbon monoxide dehydrogenase subunit G
MELTNEFRVGVPVEQAYEVLTDIERIAPCMPGAQLQEVEGDEYRGVVKVKVGPITANYKGAASFLERQAPGRVVLRAEGRETRGQGNAHATITATLVADGDGTQVTVHTDLAVSGKVAQFGRSVLGDVSAKLLGQFVECLESKVLAGAGDVSLPDTADVSLPDTADVSLPDTADVSLPDTAAPAAPVDAPVVASVDGNGNEVVAEAEPVDGEAVEPAPARAAKPAVRRVEAPEPEPVDLLATAGSPVAKRIAPALGALAVLWLLRVLLRRRHTR